ncbi:MAG TPA: MFS transporter [Phycisphaerae bacterium]|nr:MFS transporter [Phycisphaerae bacterium]
MSRKLVYAFPGAMDMVAGSVFFVCQVRLAEGLADSAVGVTGVVTTWGIVYMLCCLLVGRWVTQRSVAWMLIAACGLTAAVAAGFILLPGKAAMYALVVAQGVATALFFPPVQFFLKRFDLGQANSAAYSAAIYTLSWSIGFALGPLVAGWLWQQEWIGWRGCHVFNGLLAMALGVGVYLLKHHVLVEASPPVALKDDPPQEPAKRSRKPAVDYSRLPDLAWMAWVFGGVGSVAFAAARSVFPISGVACGLSKPELGAVLFIHCVGQAALAYALRRSRLWMYRPLPLIAFGLVGVIGLTLFAVARSAPLFYCAAACTGVYTGSTFFYLVFHSLVHPTRSARYVAINEAVVGMTGIVAPFSAGCVADGLGLPVSYTAVAVLIGLAVIAQALLHRRHTAAVRAASAGVGD